jgi:hypothetical protein
MQRLKGPFGSRKPIGLLFCIWALVLKIKVERSVWTVLERHPATDGETVQTIGYLKAFLVVECDRSERVHRRDGRFVEVDRVLVRTVERFARLIAKISKWRTTALEFHRSHSVSLSRSGLLGMRERAAIFGGHVEIAGIPGKGTTVVVRMPIQ